MASQIVTTLCLEPRDDQDVAPRQERFVRFSTCGHTVHADVRARRPMGSVTKKGYL